METTEEGWVTDQDAIDTIVALKQLRPGDQVRIINGDKYCLGHYDGKVVTITGHTRFLGEKGLFPGYEWGNEPAVAQFEENWILCRGNIGAWRRPKKRGT